MADFRHRDLDGDELHAWAGELGAVFHASSRHGDIVTVAVRYKQLQELAAFIDGVLAARHAVS